MLPGFLNWVSTIKKNKFQNITCNYYFWFLPGKNILNHKKTPHKQTKNLYLKVSLIIERKRLEGHNVKTIGYFINWVYLLIWQTHYIFPILLQTWEYIFKTQQQNTVLQNSSLDQEVIYNSAVVVTNRKWWFWKIPIHRAVVNWSIAVSV